MWIDVGSVMYMSGEAPFIGFLDSQYRPFVTGDSIPTPFEQQRDKSICVLGILNTILFDKQIY